MLVSSTHGPRHLAKQHEVDEGWEACLAIPFASASASACQRIRQLRVIRAADDDGDKRVPGGSLLALLLRLRGVQQLELDFCLADTDADEALTTSALACLPHLTSLSLGTVGLAACVSPAVAQRLTDLTIRGDLDADWLDARDHLFETVLPSITAATSVRVDCTADYENSLPLGADELRALLDGMPPSVQRLTVAPVWWSGDLDIQSDLEVDCCLTNGVLTSVNVCALPGEQEELPNHGQLSAFLAESLLPCNKLGPRLGRLGLQLCLEAVEHPPNPDPAAELLARGDTVELEAVRWCGASRIHALEEIWQRIAPPRQLRWGVGVTGTLHLLHADASGRGRRAGRGAGGSDRERSTGRLPPPLLVGDLVRRAAAHMATAAGPGHTVLCRGPGLTAALEASPKAVCKWLGMRARGAISDLTTSGVLQAESQPDSLYRPLPCAGACLLECQGAVSEEVAARTAELARQRVARAEQRRQGATGGGGGAAEDAWLQGVDVLTTSRTLNGAVMQELQELWDGAGPLLANDGSPLTPLERLVWLLGSGYGLLELPKKVDDEGWESCLAIPFASASASACQHIRQLRVLRVEDDNGDKRVPGGSLLALLLRLRGVQQLELDLALPDDETDSAVDEALTASALACLPHLTSLSLGSVGLMSCVPPAVVQRLTDLTIRGDLDEDWAEQLVGTLLPSLTAATSVRVDCTADCKASRPLSAAELRALLDGLSPTVQRLTVAPFCWSPDTDLVSDFEVDCRLTNGVLTSVDIRALPGDKEQLPSHEQLSCFLAEALLPCNKLRTRLCRLGLRLCLDAEEDPPNPDPAAEVLARCDTVELEAVQWSGESRMAALEEIWQRIAPPRQLHWSAGVTGTLQLSRTDAGGPGGGGGGRGAGGSDRECSDGRLPLPLMEEDLPRRAVERMAAAAAGVGRGRTVLLRSPSLQAALEADSQGVCKWFGARARQGVATLAAAGRLSGGLRPHANFLPLPCAGACLLECLRDLPEELASTVARDVEAWVLRAHTGGGGGRAAAEPWLQGMEVRTTALDLNGAVMQELQALWDGAGPLLANDGSPLTPLERLTWLLGSGYGLFGLPRRVRVTRAPA